MFTTKNIVMAFCALALVLLVLRSCSNSTGSVAYRGNNEVVYQDSQPQQPAPVVVQSGGSSDGSFINGLLMGHLMSGNSNSGGYASHRTTIVKKTYVNRPTFKKRYYGSRSSFKSSSYSSRRSYSRHR